MSRDFAEILAALSDAGADYLVVGAHALAAHGHPRATGDLDIWIRPTAENAARVWDALLAFGAPLDELTQEDLATPDIVFQIGLAPQRIDILTDVTGADFDEAWENRVTAQVFGRDVPVISLQDFIRNKRALGRPQDIADVARLEDDSGAQ